MSSPPLDVAYPEQKTDVKIKPRKGRPAAKPPALPLPSADEDYSELLSTRCSEPRLWLTSLAHTAGCRCPCCSTPSLGRVTARWASAQADLALLLDPSDGRVSRILHRTALTRCKSVTEKLSARLAALFPSAAADPTRGPTEPGLMLDVVSRTYLSMALAGLGPRLDPLQDVWDVTEAGLAFVGAKPSPVLRPARAGLTAAKAMASLLTLARKRNCSPEELFADAWTWNLPRDAKRSALKPATPPLGGLKKPKDPVRTAKDSGLPAKTKETKKTSALLPTVKVSSSSSSRAKCLIPTTPAAVRPSRAKALRKELSSFAFDTEVPTIVCTAVPRTRVLAPKGPARASTRPQFQVSTYKQNKVQDLIPLWSSTRNIRV